MLESTFYWHGQAGKKRPSFLIALLCKNELGYDIHVALCNGDVGAC